MTQEYHWSPISAERLGTCHPDLQRLFNKVLETFDCSVECGHRNREDQEAAFESGHTKLHWPYGKHNAMPSNAVDVKAPVTTDQMFFAGFVVATAQQMGIKIRWGGDWDSDYQTKDQTFNDLVHFELVI